VSFNDARPTCVKSHIYVGLVQINSFLCHVGRDVLGAYSTLDYERVPFIANSVKKRDIKKIIDLQLTKNT